MKYGLQLSAAAQRALAQRLPEAVAAAVVEFLSGPLTDNPHRVGRRLQAPMADMYAARRGTYRVLYRIDDQSRVVSVVAVEHRRDAYRTR